MSEKDYQAIINLYTDKYSDNGSKFPLTVKQTTTIVNLVRTHNSILKTYPDDKQKILSIYAKSASVKGITKYLGIPILHASLIYTVVKQWVNFKYQ